MTTPIGCFSGGSGSKYGLPQTKLCQQLSPLWLKPPLSETGESQNSTQKIKGGQTQNHKNTIRNSSTNYPFTIKNLSLSIHPTPSVACTSCALVIQTHKGGRKNNHVISLSRLKRAVVVMTTAACASGWQLQDTRQDTCVEMYHTSSQISKEFIVLILNILSCLYNQPQV